MRSLLAAVVAAGLALSPAPRVDAQADFSDYYVTKNHGPWMIYVTSFRGDEAEKLARAMVSELRRDFKLPAYMYSRSDFLRAEQKRQIDEFRKAHGLDENTPVRRERIVDEFVVLVGNYKDMDAASKALEKQREQFKNSDKVPMKEFFSKIFMGVEKHKPIGSSGTQIEFDKSSVQMYRENPLLRGMVVPNPHHDAVKEREEQRKKELAERKFDPEWKELNKDEKYSLLKNPKKYTLVVKVYAGASVIKGLDNPSVFGSDPYQQMNKQLDKLLRQTGRNITAQGLEAHNLADIMRHKDFNYDAWVFHTRDYSLVTVGSFDRPDDPELAKLKALLKGQWFGRVQLSEDPAIMEIPRP